MARMKGLLDEVQILLECGYSVGDIAKHCVLIMKQRRPL